MTLPWLPFGAFVVGVVLFNAMIYVMRARSVRTGDVSRDDIRLGVVSAIYAFVKECIAGAAVLVLIPYGWVMPATREGMGNRGPVILVHGRWLNRGSLWLLRRRLLRDGWSPVCCVAYPTRRAEVERAAALVRDAVLAIGRVSPKPMGLVGHGLGGLVLRYYGRRYPATGVRRLVMLGTPQSGTELSRLCPGRQRLAPGSSVLAQLEANDRVPRQFDVISISSTFDAVILPLANAEYRGAFNIKLANAGHNSLLFSARVYELLRENLAATLH